MHCSSGNFPVAPFLNLRYKIGMSSGWIHTISQGVAAALVVIANWLLAHIITSWAMPTEVETSFQYLTGLLVALLLWLAMKVFRISEVAPAVPSVPVPPVPVVKS